MSNRDVVGDEDQVPINEGEELAKLEDIGAKSKQSENVVAEEVPDKYKGKSLTEIIRMHQEAEKLLGKQGSELGELRNVADKYIKVHLETQLKDNTPAKASTQAEEKIDFFTDPEEAIKKIIEKHPTIVGTQQHVEMMRRSETAKTLENKHPGYMGLVKSEDFQNWVLGSKIRSSLMRQADQDWDLDAADELLTTYKALHSTKSEMEKSMMENTTSTARNKDALKAGQTVPSGAMTSASQNDGGRKPIYRRADIIKLMQTDRDRYDMMQDEIMAAYRENRVR